MPKYKVDVQPAVAKKPLVEQPFRMADYLRRNADSVTLGTTTEDGPHLTMMGLLQGAGLDELYMQTTRGSQKVQNILATYKIAFNTS